MGMTRLLSLSNPLHQEVGDITGYHDTWTHYLMEQDPLLLQNQADGMEVVVVDR